MSSAIGAGNRTYHEAQSHMERLPSYYRWTYGQFTDVLRGTVVELGCGAGLGLATYLDRVDQVVAVDHEAELLERLRARHPSAKIRTVRSDLTGDWRELDGVRGDAVVMMDALEHFEDDRGCLERARDLLGTGGALAVKVPAGADLYSAMDRASGHYRRYDPQDLTAVARAAGLEVVRMRHINPLGAIAYRRRNSRQTNFSRSFTPVQLAAINAAIPALSLLDALPLRRGLSLVAVLHAR